jgi:hypothetical protein
LANYKVAFDQGNQLLIVISQHAFAFIKLFRYYKLFNGTLINGNNSQIMTTFNLNWKIPGLAGFDTTT